MTDNYWNNLHQNLQLWDSHQKCGRADHVCPWPVCPASFSDLREFLTWVGFPVADKAIGIFGRDLNEPGTYRAQGHEVRYVDGGFTPPWGPERAQEAQNEPVQKDEPVDEGEPPLPEAEFQRLVVDSLNALVVASETQNAALRTLLRKVADIEDKVVFLQESIDDDDERSNEWMNDLTDWLNDEEYGFTAWVKDAVGQVLDERAGRE